MLRGLSNRVRAAIRVLAVRYRAELRYRRRSIDLVNGEVLHAHLEMVVVSQSVIRVTGTAQRSDILLSTELETSPLPRQSGRFDVEIKGALQLLWTYKAQDPKMIAQPSWFETLGALTRLGMNLITFARRHISDVFAYFLRGDSAAGDRLERALLNINEADIPVFYMGQAPACQPEDTGGATIIVPVHDAPRETRRCLLALDANTDPSTPIIIVDDASKDASLIRDLEAWVSARPNTILIRNAVNLGFAGTVNRGLERVDGHAVLLNSDAEVPRHWLPRLMAPILADANVASVTPMSNDAELLSVPVQGKRSRLEDSAPTAIDYVAEQLDPALAIAALPTGVGYCMAINGAWLARAGGFDTRFGRGYGEEVDWCRRTTALGARHLGIGTVFVAHTGHASFGEVAARDLKANARLEISNRHLGFEEIVAEFVRTDPLIGARLALGIATLAHDRPLPVYIAHKFGGGAERWLQAELAKDLSTLGGALVLRSSIQGVEVTLHTPEGVTTGILGDRTLKRLLSGAQCRHFTYSCVVGANDALDFLAHVLSAKRTQDTFRFVFHDFFPICPSQNLMDHKGSYCDLPDPEPCQQCYTALPVTNGRRPARIAIWREAWRDIVLQADDIVVFSEASHGILGRIWPEIAAKTQVRPHQLLHRPDRCQTRSRERRIGVLGDIGYNKGAYVLQRLARAHEMHFTVIGNLDPAFRHANLRVHGAYDPDEIAMLAERHGISAWFQPSVWPETFSYTTYECIATGLPTLVFDLGGQADAVRNHPGRGHQLHPLVHPDDQHALASLADALRMMLVSQ